MKKGLVLAGLLSCVVCALGADDAPQSAGIMGAEGVDPAGPSNGKGHTTSPLMTYHGGKILVYADTTPIFWGPSWTNSNFVGDKISGLDLWYRGFGGSDYARTSDEYTGPGNTQVGSLLNYSGSSYLVDTSTATGGGSSSAILAEVCKMIPNPDPTGNGYYPVYVDVKRGNAKYCAWHTAGTCHGMAVQFAFFFDLDGDPGCDPQDTTTGHSQGLVALANVSGHELSESRTDPSISAWYDSSGEENGDKCAWTFNVPSVTFSNITAPTGRFKASGPT